MKVYALSSLLNIKKEEYSQITSIQASAFSGNSMTGFARFKENLSSFIFKRQSRYQIICAQLAELANVQEFTLCLDLLDSLTNTEFHDFNNAISQYHRLQAIIFIVYGYINNAKVRKRLKILAATLKSNANLEIIKIYYTPKRSSASNKLWEDLWLAAGEFKNIQKLYFNCDALEEVSIAQWQVIGVAFSQYEKLKNLYLKSKGLGKLSKRQMSALGDALSQAQTTTSVHLAINIGYLCLTQRAILGVALAKLPNLEKLDLSANNIINNVREVRYKYWQEVGPALIKLNNLKKLNLAENNLGFFSINQWQDLGKAWAELIKLEILDLADNHLGDMDCMQMQAMAEAFGQLLALKTINLRDNAFGKMEQEVWEFFLKSLEKLQSLENLDLSGANLESLSFAHWEDLGESLAKLPRLRSLNLSCNNLCFMPQKEWQSSLAALKLIPNLQEITVNYNGLPSARLKELIKILTPNIQKFFLAILILRK